MNSDDDDSLLRAVAASPPIAPPENPIAARRAAKEERRPPDLVDTSPLELGRWRMRFARPETEVAYRTWLLAKTIPFIRGGAVAALIGPFLILPMLPFVMRATLARTIATMIPLVVAPVVCLVVTYRASLARLVLPSVVLATAVYGCWNVGICFFMISAPAIGALNASANVYFAAAIFRLRPALSIVATLPVLVFCQLLLAKHFLAGHLEPELFKICSGAIWTNLAIGLVASASTDRASRESYRQEWIVQAQREVIERLQRAEVKRQVAERARGLSEALVRLGDKARVPARLTLGDVVEERYRIVRAIGSGAMGQVHEVERISDGKRLALKTLTGVAHKDALARFAREAQVAAELEHANVVAALDIGITATGTLFIVMELVAGDSLAASRARYGDVKFALGALRQIAAALSVMHARGIVHRDLKPANILLDGEQVKVADFGLAGLVDGAPLADTHEEGGAISPALTRTGAIMGTPLYMAPELVGGAREAGPGADVFSFGVVAYELLSRELPFAAPPVIERLSGRDLPALKPLAQARPELPPLLTSLVDRCLAVAPEARPSAEALVDFFCAPYDGGVGEAGVFDEKR